MSDTFEVGDRFTAPFPGTVIAVLGGGGVVTGYEIALDGCPDNETWLVPVESSDLLVRADTDVPAGVSGDPPPSVDE